MMRNNLQPLNLAKAVYSVALLAVFFLVSLASAHAGEVTLGWDDNTEPPELVGYKVYYRTASTTYATQPGNPVAVVPKSTNPQATDPEVTIELPDGSYYFAVTAYNVTADNRYSESGISEEISTTLGPSLVANFSVSPNPISGPAPLQVTFTDQSLGAVSEWDWMFGDGSSSNVANPTHNYTTAGDYTVSLTVSDSLGNQSSPKIMPVQVTSSTGGLLPSPWLDKDISSSVSLPGSASYNNGTFTVKGSGADIGGTEDAFHFVYQPLNGNGTIVARVVGLTNTNAWAKAGVMIRESLDYNARNAMVAITPTSGLVVQQRRNPGGNTRTVAARAAVKAPYWVKLTRRLGTDFIAYQSANGSNWTQIARWNIDMRAPIVYVGLALTSHNNSDLSTATLDNVLLSQ